MDLEDIGNTRSRPTTCYRRNGILTIAVMSVIAMIQLLDVFSGSLSMKKTLNNNISFDDISRNASHGNLVPQSEENRTTEVWSPPEVVVVEDSSLVSRPAAPVAVSNTTTSSASAGLLKKCSRKHDLYRTYMTQTPTNYLMRILESSDAISSLSRRFGKTNSSTTTETSSHDDDDDNRPSFLLIGDSLDRNLLHHICTVVGGMVKKVDPGRKYARRQPVVCSSPTLEMGYFNIFGMSKPCDNGGFAQLHDSRSFNSTLDRVAALLPEVLRHFETKPHYVLMGSALWDLSCVNSTGISSDFLDEYRDGMRQLYDYVASGLGGNTGNDVEVYWRTSPPVRKSYSEKWENLTLADGNGRGRTRTNQRVLNQILQDTFREHHLGRGIVDWWQITQGVSEKFLEKELPDGRHYTFCSSLTFFNEWLEQIFQRNGSAVEH